MLLWVGPQIQAMLRSELTDRPSLSRQKADAGMFAVRGGRQGQCDAASMADKAEQVFPPDVVAGYFRRKLGFRQLLQITLIELRARATGWNKEMFGMQIVPGNLGNV